MRGAMQLQIVVEVCVHMQYYQVILLIFVETSWEGNTLNVMRAENAESKCKNFCRCSRHRGYCEESRSVANRIDAMWLDESNVAISRQQSAVLHARYECIQSTGFEMASNFDEEGICDKDSPYR